MALKKAFDGETFYWYDDGKPAEPEMKRDCQQGRLMSTDEWLATHKRHGEASKQLNEHQPPRGTYHIYTLVCPCGARHVITERER